MSKEGRCDTAKDSELHGSDFAVCGWTAKGELHMGLNHQINVGYRLVWGYRIVSTDSKIILYLWK